MKTLCFINSPKTIQRILHENPQSRSTAMQENEDWDLKFSTFKSDDYKFYDDLPHFYQKNYAIEDSIEQLSYELQIDEESESSEDQAIKKLHETSLNFKRLNFRNNREKILNCLRQKTHKNKKLNFRNQSSVIKRCFPGISKFIE